MNKRRIVIASVLKPVDDTRMFEKMGASLIKQGEYEVTIIGQTISHIPAHAGIKLSPLRKVNRKSLERFILPFIIGFKILKVRPSVLIVNTHELLIVSILCKILFGCRIIYDIRENYYRNIRFSETYSPRLGLLLARYVRWKERLAAPLFNHFILAEKSYEWQLPFLKNKFTVIENKALPVDNSIDDKSRSSMIRLLFSGTIAKSTGILQAISLADSLHQFDVKVKLSIIGYCALYKTRVEILEAVKDKPYIQLIGFNELVPHHKILNEIQNADFGVIYYPPAEHTSGLMPTKLYEYMANQLPILTWQDQTYANLIIDNQAGLVLNDLLDELFIQKLKTSSFYPKPISGIMWEEEAFVELIRKFNH